LMYIIYLPVSFMQTTCRLPVDYLSTVDKGLSKR